MATEQQEKIINHLLQTTITEPDVQAELKALLQEIGCHPELGAQTGSGPADVLLAQHRIVIEAKRPGLADHPHEPQPRENNETPFQQVERYITALRRHYLNRFDLEELGDRSWLGIVTDGRIWHVWRWPHRMEAKAEAIRDNYRPSSPDEIVSWLEEIIDDGGRVGRPWPPVQLAREFLPDLPEWQELYASLSGVMFDHTRTKWNLWKDMMIESGMLPTNEQARIRQFVAHTYLIMIAKGVIWTLTHKEQDRPNPNSVLGDGFEAWVLEQQTGRQMAGNLLDLIHGWDWRARPGDILRDVYAELIDPKDRKDFGEFYTPDWLAELVVQSVLDSEWCKQSILSARNPEGLEDGIGVLDPACGSGTFLYHAASKLLNQHAIQELSPVRRADIVASLVNGLDVHPVAVEIARATLLRALPAQPSMGASAIRIYISDSLDTPQQGEGLLVGSQNGSLLVASPHGSEMNIPLSWIDNENFDDQLRMLVLAAKEGQFLLPPEISNKCEEEVEMIQELLESLTNIIIREGNSVWTWFITNRIATERLRARKINRIVANPPWVKIANIQVENRKRALEDLAKTKGEYLWVGGKNAPHFDIAQLFIHRCRRLFMHDPKGNSAGWLVKRSALGASHWQKSRELHASRLEDRIQKVDLINLQPFGGGDARRCCLILENTRMEPTGSDSIKAIELPRGRKLDSFERLNRLEGILEFEPAPEPIEQGPSGYLDEKGRPFFRQGATLVPHVLTLLDSKVDGTTQGACRVTTRRSQKGAWLNIFPQTGEVPESWIRPVLRSIQLLPFTTMQEDEYIIPVDQSGSLHENPGSVCEFWQDLENIYQEHRGKGHNTPRTLLDNLNYNQKLSKQLPLDPNQGLRLVLYPSSGDIMRGTRSIPRIFDSKVYYFCCEDELEAAYLVGLLNAPTLCRAFKECQSSDRDFHLYPWRRVPIPEFDPDNVLHQQMAELTIESEKSVNNLLQELMEELNEGQTLPGYEALSNRIRERLAEEGISQRLDKVTSLLLPEQVR